jgi:predicted nucleic acid-binding protein
VSENRHHVMHSHRVATSLCGEALSGGVLQALGAALDAQRHIVWCNVELSDATLLSVATGLTVYDASYLWLSGFLGADLVTLDQRLVAASRQD